MILGEHDNLLLVVDQFEELFRFPSGSDENEEALAFVKLLLNAGHQEELPLYVIITMRSDFLGDCMRFSGLVETINNGQFLVPGMDREQFRSAITGPASVFYEKIAPPLETQLLNDVGDNLDQLPILQHALMRTWDFWEQNAGGEGPIELNCFQEIGGLEHALDYHAEEIYVELGTERLQTVCKQVFKVITAKGSDNRGIRRPTPFGEIRAIAQATPEEVRTVLEAFRKPGRTFIMPPVGTRLEDKTIIDISHESFMRMWKRLARWADEESESESTYRRIHGAAVLHEDGKAGLWRPPELQLATVWQEKEKPTSAWAKRLGGNFDFAMGFIATSDEAYSAELEEKERQRKKQLRRAWTFSIVVGIVALIAIWMFYNAQVQKQEAIRQKGEANRQRELAEIREQEAKDARRVAEDSTASAIRSRKIADDQRGIAEDQRGIAENQRGIAIFQKSLALKAKDTAMEAKERALASKILADTNAAMAGREKVKAQRNEELANEQRERAERLRMLSISRAMAVKSVNLEEGDSQLPALLAFQSWKFNKEFEGPEHYPDLFDALHEARKGLAGDNYNSVRKHGGGVRSLITQGGNSQLLSGGGDGSLIFGPMGGTGTPLFNGITPIRAVTFRSATSILFAEQNGNLYLTFTDMGSEGELTPLIKLPGEIYDLVSLKNTNWVVAGGQNATLYYVALSSGKVEREVPLGGIIRDLEVVPGSPDLLACNSLGEVWLIPSDPNKSPGKLYPQQEGQPKAFSIAMHPSGKTLAVGTQNGEILLLTQGVKGPPTSLQGHKKLVNKVVFSPDGRRLASAGTDGTARLWNLDNVTDLPVRLNDKDGFVWSVAFSSQGKYVLVGGANGRVRSYPLNMDELTKGMCKAIGRNLTPTEWERYVSDVNYRKTCDQ